MLVKALKDKVTPTHTLVKGTVYNMQSNVASKLISLKICKKPTKKEIEDFRNGN